MAAHEDTAAELHATLEQRTGSIGHRGSVDMAGGKLGYIEKEGVTVDAEQQHDSADGLEPTEHEKKTLRRIGDKFPTSAYLIAVVELCERFTCTSDGVLRSGTFADFLFFTRRLRMPRSLPKLHQQPPRWSRRPSGSWTGPRGRHWFEPVLSGEPCA